MVKRQLINLSNTISYHYTTIILNFLTQNLTLATANFLSNPSQQSSTALSDLTHAMNLFIEKKSEIYLKRLRLHKDLKGELPSKFISSLLQQQTCSKISSIETGNTTLYGEDAAKFIVESFQKIYQVKPEHPHAASRMLRNLPKLGLSDQQALSVDISLAEVTEAIQSFSIAKSPGPDGLTAGIYKSFHDLLAPTLVRVFNDFLSNQISASDHTQFLFAYIACVPKKVSVIKSFSHIRPISLMNYDYKILSKIINNRLSKVMGKIIHTDQTGYIKGRFILTNAMALRMSLSYNKSVHCFIDFEKAFDNIQHKWIRDCLQAFNFPDKFVEWVKRFQDFNTSSFYFNNKTHGLIKILSGTRQGDPVSGNFFDIGIEPLAIQIRNHPYIIPAPLSPSFSKVIGIHVDDVWLNTADSPSMKIGVGWFSNLHQHLEVLSVCLNLLLLTNWTLTCLD